MSKQLIRWSYFYSLACLLATALSLLLHHRGPLILAGAASFTALMIAYGVRVRFDHLLRAANLLTLGRLLLTLALFVAPLMPEPGPFVIITSLVILIADGFDGWLARRRNESSEFGEYFDKETDAFFLLTLCLLAYWQEKVGLWILIPGIMRYAFVIVLTHLNPENQKEYRSNWARVIYVCMISALLSVFVLPASIYGPAVTLATTALLLSFAHYFRWILKSAFGAVSHNTVSHNTVSLNTGKLNIDEHNPKKRTAGSVWILAIGSFCFLNTLLLLPSFIANIETSTFFPVPQPDSPSLKWDRGWYDYVLYFFVRRPNLDIFRICVDLVALITVIQLFRKTPVIRLVAVPAFMVLLVYETYDAIAYSFFHRPGILFEDAQYAVNLYYLLKDALSTGQAPVLIAIVSGVVVLTWMLPWCFKRMAMALDTLKWRGTGLLFSGVFWPVVLLIWVLFGPASQRPVLRTVVGKIVHNAASSITLKRHLTSQRDQPVDEVYFTFAERTFETRPNLYIILVESYGSVIYEYPALKNRHDSLMASIEGAFRSDGWQTISQQTRAPVSGGLSWLSMATVLSGMVVDNKTRYTRFRKHIDAYPHLVDLLGKNGYTTITLQPPNRARPGLPIENPYRFDNTVYFKTLNYSGPAYGVWIIPDQYSLNFTHEEIIGRAQEPIFLFFETASTHAPWSTPPPRLDDWRAFNSSSFQTTNVHRDEAAKFATTLFAQLNTFYRHRFNPQVSNTAHSYYDTIAYDWGVLSEYILTRAAPNSLFIITGDHQPPLLKSNDFLTPIHIISQDSTLTHRFTRYGFQPGLTPPGTRPGRTAPASTPALDHAGLYSMLVEVLTLPAASRASLPGPAYRPTGIAPSILSDAPGRPQPHPDPY